MERESIPTPEEIRSTFEILKKAIVIPKIELDYEDPYRLLVGVILSARATDSQVNKATPNLFKHAKTPEEMVKFGIESLLKAISSIGCYRNKAKYIIAMSKMLVEKFDSKIPSTREELMLLPGVGRKSADVILNVVYKKPTIAVDTHVAQFARTIGLSKSYNPDKIADELERILPACLDYDTLVVAQHLMVLYNRRCKGRGHECAIPGYCARRKAISSATK